MRTQSAMLPRQTARSLLSKGQAGLLGGLGLVFAAGLVVTPHTTAIACVSAALLFYACFVGLKLSLWLAATTYTPPATAPVTVDDPDLPTYTLFVPLYKEANMLASLVDSISRLEYPQDRLQVLLLLEEDDVETRAEAIGIELGSSFEIVLTPDVLPRGKPKALNIGLAQATGALSVIYDAEDRPDPDQLLKAVAAFRAAPENVACVQARLFFWNEDSSWITRFYWTEYVAHFDWVLSGLAKLGLVPPLGGTSNHFRTQALRDIAIPRTQLPEGAEGVGGWDPWNVTEDAELAGAFAMNGYRVLMIDSVTKEEATARLGVADKQRRRWLKGYLQTGLVYTRRPIRTARQMGVAKWFCYNLLMIGTPISLLLNPLFWSVTVLYFSTRSTVISQMFPPPLFYTGILLTVGGNLLLFYQLIAACLKRGGYGSVKYMLLTPVWWAFTSYSCYRTVAELINPKTRHVWHKTAHGHDLHKEAAGSAITSPVPIGSR